MTDKPSTPIERLRARVAEVERIHHSDSPDDPGEGWCMGCDNDWPCLALVVHRDLLTLAEALHSIADVAASVDEDALMYSIGLECTDALAKIGGSDAEEAR